MVLIGCAAFLTIEGAASVLLALWDTGPAASAATAERRHTVHDSLLGWVNEPNIHIPDLYGPGKYLRTNERGFRSDVPTPATYTTGRRIICSGDSFTLGYGVANDETWCHLLQAQLPGVRTVNMGQGGYGLDQAYLWYSRDGQALEHVALLLAVITDDFNRMQSSRFLGYAKPLLVADDSGLVVTNVPVPAPGDEKLQYWRRVATSLNLFEIMRRAARKAIGPQPTNRARVVEVTDEHKRVVLAMLRTLRERNEESQRLTVLVYLPAQPDYVGEGSDRWRTWLDSIAQTERIIFVDLIQELRKLPPEEIPGLFITGGQVPFPWAAGHYSAAGNAWVAEALGLRLATLLESAPAQ